MSHAQAISEKILNNCNTILTKESAEKSARNR